MSKEFIPDIQYFGSNLFLKSLVGKDILPFSLISKNLVDSLSFINLCTNSEFNGSEYLYKYSLQPKSLYPLELKNRLFLSPIVEYYSLSESGENFFNLQEVDIELLNAMLYYRLSNNIQLVEGVTNKFESGTLTATFDSLSTRISKLIFLYLDMKVNQNLENYNNLDLISDEDSLLECILEFYVIDEFFNNESAKEVYINQITGGN